MKKGDITPFKDSNDQTIKIGDELHIFATNQYNGTVNITDDVICLETAFFNKPLCEHLTAIDLKSVYVYNEPEHTNESHIFI